jgi:hypothetical protein
MPQSVLQHNTHLLAQVFNKTQKQMREGILELAKQLGATPEETTVYIRKALWIQQHLRLEDWFDALAVFALPEPSFDRTHWFKSLQSITMARIGLTADQRPREKLELNESAIANWYHLCRTPSEVFALHFQLGCRHLAVWRLAHMWDDEHKQKKQSATT